MRPALTPRRLLWTTSVLLYVACCCPQLRLVLLVSAGSPQHESSLAGRPTSLPSSTSPPGPWTAATSTHALPSSHALPSTAPQLGLPGSAPTSPPPPPPPSSSALPPVAAPKRRAGRPKGVPDSVARKPAPHPWLRKKTSAMSLKFEDRNPVVTAHALRFIYHHHEALLGRDADGGGHQHQEGGEPVYRTRWTPQMRHDHAHLTRTAQHVVRGMMQPRFLDNNRFFHHVGMSLLPLPEENWDREIEKRLDERHGKGGGKRAATKERFARVYQGLKQLQAMLPTETAAAMAQAAAVAQGRSLQSPPHPPGPDAVPQSHAHPTPRAGVAAGTTSAHLGGASSSSRPSGRREAVWPSPESSRGSSGLGGGDVALDDSRSSSGHGVPIEQRRAAHPSPTTSGGAGQRQSPTATASLDPATRPALTAPSPPTGLLARWGETRARGKRQRVAGARGGAGRAGVSGWPVKGSTAAPPTAVHGPPRAGQAEEEEEEELTPFERMALERHQRELNAARNTLAPKPTSAPSPAKPRAVGGSSSAVRLPSPTTTTSAGSAAPRRVLQPLPPDPGSPEDWSKIEQHWPF